MKITSYKPQEAIYRRGVVGFQKLTVVVEGSLKKLKGGNVVATKGQCYGQEPLLDRTKMLDDDIVMQSYGVVAEISEDAFREAVRNQDYVTIVTPKKSQFHGQLRQPSNTIKLALSNSDVRSFQVITTLKTPGQFGLLYLLANDRQTYVLKTIEKR